MIVTHREIPLARVRIIVAFPAGGGANITAAGQPRQRTGEGSAILQPTDHMLVN
jgi:hypothetical protein